MYTTVVLVQMWRGGRFPVVLKVCVSARRSMVELLILWSLAAKGYLHGHVDGVVRLQEQHNGAHRTRSLNHCSLLVDNAIVHDHYTPILREGIQVRDHTLLQRHEERVVVETALYYARVEEAFPKNEWSQCRIAFPPMEEIVVARCLDTSLRIAVGTAPKDDSQAIIIGVDTTLGETSGKGRSVAIPHRHGIVHCRLVHKNELIDSITRQHVSFPDVACHRVALASEPRQLRDTQPE